MRGALEQSRAAEADQTRVFQPTRWTTDLCPRLSLDPGAGGRDERRPAAGPSALVDQPRRAPKRQTQRRRARSWPNSPRTGAAGWCMSSTRALPVRPGSSASWRTPCCCLSCAGRKGYQAGGPGWQAKLAWQLVQGTARHGSQGDLGCPATGQTHGGHSLCAQPPCPSTSIRSGWWFRVPGPGSKPWYLLTNIPITSVEDAWQIVFIYARRWQIEMTLRFEKCELGFEVPAPAQMGDADASSSSSPPWRMPFSFSCSRPALRNSNSGSWIPGVTATGKWSRETPTPLYRLRLALSQLWRVFRPVFLPLLN